MNWKGQVINAATWWLLPLLGAAAAWLALRSPRLDGLGRRRWAGLAVALFLLTRVGTHLVVFHLFRYDGGHDLRNVWLPVANAVLDGTDPSVHIDNLYGPLFPECLAAGLRLWGRAYPPGIDTVFVLADGLGLLVLFGLARRHLTEPLARRLVLATLLSPVLWHGVVVRTQEESLFVLFLLVALDLLDRGREGVGALATALGTVFTKALFPLWAFPVLLAAGGGRRRATVRVVAAGALTVGALAAFHFAGWQPLGAKSGTLSVRGSSAWLLAPGLAHAGGAAFTAGVLLSAAGCVVAALAALPAREGESVVDRAARGAVAVQGAFFLLSPFTLPPHLVHALPFLWWLAVRGGACAERLSPTSLALAGGLVLWQVPALAVNSEHWSPRPWLVAPFVLWCAWTGWLAWTAPLGEGRSRAG